jgi:EAL domain-containing protein (putative c-di-GMP-specific phosphodiesterase class I)
MYTKDGDTQKLIANADAAMYKAKEEGKNQFKFYDAQIESASDLMIQLQSDLCLAIERKEFRLDFLPKIDVKTMTIVGAEALIRWIHPIKGELLPNKFLPAAERLGLITEISDWVLDECCSTIAYAKQHNIDLDLSINLPVQQFLKESLVKNILKTIIYYDLNTKNLSFEIKESLAVNNQTQFKAVLDHFKEAGINVVLDDFGLQTFSLSHLQSLNIDGIKIDRSFIRNVNKNKASKSIIEALVKIAHALNFSVVAEGVENIDQRDTLVFLGCDYLQGHLFSKPLGIDALLAFYKDIETKQLELKLETDKTSPQEIPGHLTESA